MCLMCVFGGEWDLVVEDYMYVCVYVYLYDYHCGTNLNFIPGK